MRVSRPPINLALLAACVRRAGHEASICDLDWYEGKIGDMATLINLREPDVVGFTCLTPRIEVTLAIVAEIKRLNPNVKIVIGGAHVNAVKEHTLYPEIDFAIYGEAEEALVELLCALEEGNGVEGIRNLIYHKDDKVVVNSSRPFIQDLDKLPFPAWELLDLESYEDPATFSGIHMGVMTSRGCPWNCIFCSSGVTWGRKVRFRSADNVVEELKQIMELGITNIMFYDDTFTLNKQRFLSICGGIMEQRLNLKYYCQARVDTIDKEIATTLAESGCIGVALGIESGDEEILKVLRKGIKKEQMYDAIEALKSARVPIIASYILGSPGETHASIAKTFELAKLLKTDQSKFMICTPFPSTALYDMAIEKGMLPENPTPAQFAELTYYQRIAANLSEVSDQDLLNYQEYAYKSFPQKSLVKERTIEKVTT